MIAALRRHLFGPPAVSLPVHALRGGVLVLGVGSVLVALVMGVAHLLGGAAGFGMADGPTFATGWIGWLGVVVLAPLLETLVLALMLGALGFTGLGNAAKAIICGLVWGLLHGMVAPVWFFAPAFAFFVFSCAWLAWRPRGLGMAFLAAMLPHVVNNAVAFGLVLAADHFA